MLSNNKKTLLLSTLIFSGISVGGSVNAAQTTADPAQQTITKPGQLLELPQHYKFPPQNAVKELPANTRVKPAAPNIRQAAKPTMRTAPVAPATRRAPYAYPQNRYAPQIQPTPPGFYNNRPASVPMAAPFGPRGGSGYGNPYAARPYGTQPYYPGAYNSSPYNSSPYNRGPNNRGPYNQGPYGRPYNNNSGPFGNNPMDNFGFGPFSKNSSEAPWETWPFGGRDSVWNRREMPFKQQNPGDWFQPGDPKEGMAIMWDDLISAPDELGEMPGGWHVPSISTPNPVDLEDQLEKASKEIPDLIRIYD